MVFLGMFLIPFWGLLFVATKKSPLLLSLFATISLAALWLERYLLVTPSVTPLEGPAFGLPEAGPLLGFLGCFLLAYGIFARTFPMVSPRLATLTLAEERKHGHDQDLMHDERPADFALPQELDRREVRRVVGHGAIWKRAPCRQGDRLRRGNSNMRSLDRDSL
jgi:hypothetical protein